MSLSISDQNRTIADIQTIQAHGRFGVGNYILLLRLTMLPTQVREDYTIRNLKLRLDSSTPQGPRTIGWAFIDGTGVLPWNSYSSSHDIFFWLPLSAVQIDHLEKLRGGGDLNVKLSLYSTVDHAGSTSDCASVSDFVIPQQQWIAALKEMDFADRFLFEIGFPVEAGQNNIFKEQLQSAWQHLCKGHYAESVMYCRKVIELAEKHNDDKNKASAAVTKYKSSDREAMTLEERLLFMREAIKNVTQVSVHPMDDATFSRSQARAILGATIATVSAFQLDA